MVEQKKGPATSVDGPFEQNKTITFGYWLLATGYEQYAIKHIIRSNEFRAQKQCLLSYPC